MGLFDKPQFDYGSQSCDWCGDPKYENRPDHSCNKTRITNYPKKSHTKEETIVQISASGYLYALSNKGRVFRGQHDNQTGCFDWDLLPQLSD